MKDSKPLALYFILIASMGPYVYKNFGIRTDHVIVYSIFLLFLIKNKKISLASLQIFILLIIGSILPLVGEYLMDFESNIFQILSGMDNHIIFAITFYITSTIFIKENSQDMFYKITLFYINILCINSLITLISSVVDISEYLNIFHNTTIENIDYGIESVSMASSKMNRFSGIFDQPLESGFAYSLGLISLIYIFKKMNLPSFQFYMYVLLLVMGGILSISKVFIYGGLLLAVIFYLILIKNLFLLIYISAPIIILSTLLLINSGGYDFFDRLLNVDNLFENLIFGRYDSESDILANSYLIFHNNLFFGIGYSGRSIFDSGFYQYFYQGGLLQILLQMFILFYFLKLALYVKKDLFLYIFIIFILQLLTLLGGPTILANRSPIFLAMAYGFFINYAFNSRSLTAK
jgi:hypothetical protein